MSQQRTKPPVAITGAGAGIGYAIAKAFAETGHPVAIIDIDGDKAARAATTVADETGVEAIGVRADVADDVALNAIDADIQKEVEAAVAFAENSDWPTLDQATRHMFA